MDGILCRFDFKNLKLNYTASNNSFYIIRNNELMVKKADKMPVGKSLRENESFTNNDVELLKGDVIYTLTDGYADQFGGPDGKKFKYKPLEKLLLELHTKPLSDQKTILNNTIEKWMGNLEQVDDILIIGIKI
jgi:serine phosphatase RsbU (regulator of sigma subunit)